MSDAMKVKLLFVADEVRDHPQLDGNVLVGYEPTITARLNQQQREHVIAEICARVKEMCKRDDNTEHNCVSVKEFRNIELANVMLIYGRRCIYQSGDFEAFFQAANNIVHKARVATVRASTRC